MTEGVNFSKLKTAHCDNDYSLENKSINGNKEFRNLCIDLILKQERKRINLDKDEQLTADNLREDIIENEKKRICFMQHNTKSLHTVVKRKTIKPLAYLQKHKLNKMLSSLENKSKHNESQKEFKKCLAHMHPPFKLLWTSPSCVMKAINNCLLTRNWNSLTYLLIELIHFTGDIYKPLIRNVYSIMDKLHPIIYENNLQGEFKKIRKYHQVILNDTTVV